MFKRVHMKIFDFDKNQNLRKIYNVDNAVYHIKMTMILDHRTLLCHRNMLRYSQQKKRFMSCFFKYSMVCSEIPFTENSYHMEAHQLTFRVNQLAGFYMFRYDVSI